MQTFNSFQELLAKTTVSNGAALTKGFTQESDNADIAKRQLIHYSDLLDSYIGCFTDIPGTIEKRSVLKTKIADEYHKLIPNLTKGLNESNSKIAERPDVKKRQAERDEINVLCESVASKHVIIKELEKNNADH